MKGIVWIAAKPGVARKHSSTDGFTEPFASSLREHGYSIIAVEYDLPPRFEIHTDEAPGRIVDRSATSHPIPTDEPGP